MSAKKEPEAVKKKQCPICKAELRLGNAGPNCSPCQEKIDRTAIRERGLAF